MQLRPIHMFAIILVVGVIGFLLRPMNAKDKTSSVVSAYAKVFCEAGPYIQKKYRIDRRKAKGRRFVFKTEKIDERWWNKHASLIPVYHYNVKQMVHKGITGRQQRVIAKQGIKEIYSTGEQIFNHYNNTCKSKKRVGREAVIDVSAALLIAAYVPPPAEVEGVSDD